MKRGFKRTILRYSIILWKSLLIGKDKTPATFLLIVAISATISYTIKSHYFKREPASKRPVIFDLIQPHSRVMIPEYNRNLQQD